MNNEDHDQPGSRDVAETVRLRFDHARLRQAHLLQRRTRLQRQIEFLLEDQATRRSSRRLVDSGESPSNMAMSLERESTERIQLDQLRGELVNLERQIEAFDSHLAAMQVDLAYQLGPGQHLAEISRAIGQERGADLSLHL